MTFSGGYAVSGRIEGVALGTMTLLLRRCCSDAAAQTLLLNGEVVAGTVRTPRATSRIRLAIPAMSIRDSDLMAISSERSDADLAP